MSMISRCDAVTQAKKWAHPLIPRCTNMVLLICENEFQHLGSINGIFQIISPCLSKCFFTDTHYIDSLLFLQNFMKIPTLGGGLEILASI